MTGEVQSFTRRSEWAPLARAVRPVLGYRRDLAGTRLYQHLGVGIPRRVVRAAVRREDVVDGVRRRGLVLRGERGVDAQAAGGEQLSAVLRRSAERLVLQDDV